MSTSTAGSGLSWRKSDYLSSEEANQAIAEASQRALDQRRARFKEDYEGQEDPYWAGSILPQGDQVEELQYRLYADLNYGEREVQEETYFHQENGEYVLAGVFDGHGSNKRKSNYAVTEYVRTYASVNFRNELMEAEGNVHKAFESMIHALLEKEADNFQNAWKDLGTTAVICYIDKKTRRIFTATIGDSQANIYRKQGETENLRVIPLSPIHDWTVPEARAKYEDAKAKYRELQR